MAKRTVSVTAGRPFACQTHNGEHTMNTESIIDDIVAKALPKIALPDFNQIDTVIEAVMQDDECIFVPEDEEDHTATQLSANLRLGSFLRQRLTDAIAQWHLAHRAVPTDEQRCHCERCQIPISEDDYFSADDCNERGADVVLCQPCAEYVTIVEGRGVDNIDEVQKWINVYRVTREYGGSEDGGWWYNRWTPVESISVPESMTEIVALAMRAKHGHGEDIYVKSGGEEIRICIEDDAGEPSGPPVGHIHVSGV